MKTFRKILCVDDQRSVHAMELSVLKELIADGTEVVHAYDGLEALRQLVAHPDIDLVLLDIIMPVLNGLAFMEQKQRTPFAAIPVIVISSEGDDNAEVSHALSLGARAVLPKNFGQGQLLEAISRLS